jgi:hypothetical protein
METTTTFTESFKQGFNEGYSSGQQLGEDGGLFAVIIFLVIIAALIRGGIKTFQRNWILALLMLLFVGPLWVCWAIVEIFTGKIGPKVHYVEVKNT